MDRTEYEQALAGVAAAYAELRRVIAEQIAAFICGLKELASAAIALAESGDARAAGGQQPHVRTNLRRQFEPGKRGAHWLR